MTKKTQQRATRASAPSGMALDVDVRVGILRTVAKSIYPSTPRKIREAVANAMDNDASWLILYVDPSARTLSIFDNGKGITTSQFADIFKSLGYGMLKHEAGKLSYFGLGLMSIFQLGSRVRMYTRPAGQRSIQVLQVNTADIFAEKNENKPISFLKDHIQLKTDAQLDRASSPAPILDKHISQLFGSLPGSYSEIVIEDLNPQDLSHILSEDFIKELRQLLPLRPEKNDPFLKRFKDQGLAKSLTGILANVSFCPTIDVYFGIAERTEIQQLWKYFPEFRRELEFGKADVQAGVHTSGDFAYYIIHTTEDLERQQKEGSETGFWVRNRNFLVRSADFFERPGSRKKYVNEPLKNWMFGEVFHRNMNPFLSVARDEYLWDSPEFEAFRDGIVGLIQHLNQELRQCWQEKNRIMGNLVQPFLRLGDPGGPVRRTEDLLRTMRGGQNDDASFRQEMLEQLVLRRKTEIERDDLRVDTLLKGITQPILLADDENVVVEIDPAVQEIEGRATWDPQRKRLDVALSPRLFDPQEVTFLGKRFEIIFVAAKEDAPGVSINLDAERIYVNPFNHDLKAYNISFIDVYIAVELADALARNKAELKEYLLKLLGRETVDVGRYLTPLADELMRGRRSR